MDVWMTSAFRHSFQTTPLLTAGHVLFCYQSFWQISVRRCGQEKQSKFVVDTKLWRKRLNHA